MEPIWIVFAFFLGLLSRLLKLPPLVGFLAAGFLLNGLVTTELEDPGGHSLDVLQTWSDYGVYLLLFSIGLKLRLRSLASPAIWAGTQIHMAITVGLMIGLLLLLAAFGLGGLEGYGLGKLALIGFALSFSSTVFAVKVLDEHDEMNATHGRLAIGVLIMQDIIAIVFLTLSTGKFPSPWALLLLGLPLLRPVLNRIMDRCGHGELLVLFGLLLVLGAVTGFEAVGMKPDLGALIIGVLVGQHPKADELAKMLFGFKELFLLGFFLSIGFSVSPTWGDFGIALLIILVLPIKIALFYLIFTRFHLRSRTATLASLSLGNYSEFGLIVGALGVANGWMDSRWLCIAAIALAISFVAAAPVNAVSHTIYARLRTLLMRFETKRLLPEDQPIDVGDADVLVFGMGRVGASAYDELRQTYGRRVLGLDLDIEKVQANIEAGRRVVRGDASDRDFWERLSPGSVKLVLLTMEDHDAHLYAAEQLEESHFDGEILAAAGFSDEQAELEAAGIGHVLNFRTAAGVALGEEAMRTLGDDEKDA